MNSKCTIIVILFLIGITLQAQQSDSDSGSYLAKVNKGLPHKFKEIKTGATLEAFREHGVVKIYMLIDDIEQYDEILVERSDELRQNYSQCKLIKVEKGKYKNNYVEVVDQYPLSSKMPAMYRIKAVTAEGITRMFAPVVPVVVGDDSPGDK